MAWFLLRRRCWGTKNPRNSGLNLAIFFHTQTLIRRSMNTHVVAVILLLSRHHRLQRRQCPPHRGTSYDNSNTSMCNPHSVIRTLWSTDTPVPCRIRCPTRVRVRVRHRHDTRTTFYILDITGVHVSVSMSCQVSVSVLVLHSSYSCWY